MISIPSLSDSFSLELPSSVNLTQICKIKTSLKRTTGDFNGDGFAALDSDLLATGETRYQQWR